MAAVRGRQKIRPPRKGLSSIDNAVDLEEAWDVIKNSLREMHTKNASALSFEAIYRQAYKIVLKKQGSILYERVQDLERNWLRDDVRCQLKELIAPSLLPKEQASGHEAFANERRHDGEKYMKAVKQAFEDHQVVMNMATDVFMYLDRVYCSESKLPSIYTASMLLFRDYVLRAPSGKGAPTMSATLETTMLDQIEMDRRGDTIDKQVVKSCVAMLEALYESAAETEDQRLYLTSFEPNFLEASTGFYEAESKKLLKDADAASYCREVSRRLREENERCNTTLSVTTRPKITSVLEHAMIKDKMRDLINMDSGVAHMIDNNRFEDLELLYQLNSRIDQQKKELTHAVQRRLQQTAYQINDATSSSPQADQEQPENELDKSENKAKSGGERVVNQNLASALKWVEAVLKLKDTYDHTWIVSLHSDPVIQPALTRSLTESINLFPRCSEFVSLFIDENMKKSLKDKTEDEIDQVLEKAIILIRHIQDKDMFERYYKKHLSKRLLMGKSLSIENEREMIRKMKVELGNSFVSKMESMFKDMQLSEELTNAYHNRFASSGGRSKGIDLNIHVLTSNMWPLSETMPAEIPDGEAQARGRVIYPPVIENVKAKFEHFYGQKHSGRQLTWLPHYGTADVRAVFPAVAGGKGRVAAERSHEINVSTYGMLIILLFNEVPPGVSVSFDNIQAHTNIREQDLIRNLQSLAVASKTRILIKEPMSRDVKRTDRFSFNDKFDSGFRKLKVGVVAANNKVEGEKERRETERKNDDSRGFVIEAAIVRIMKQRKELMHQQLVAETLAQLAAKFKPDVNMIKKRIEALIEREYLERMEGSAQAAYRYLA